MIRILFSALISILLFSCNIQTKEEPSIYKGTIHMAIDESLKPLMDAQLAVHKVHYPKTTIVPHYMPETKGINLLLKDSMDVVASTREFNANEMAIMTNRGIKYIPAPMALDAVALVSNKSNSDTTITFDELRAMLTDKNSKIKLIFDRNNSSNLNVIMEKLKLKDINRANVFSADGNLQVIDFVKKMPNTLGFIGYNWISDDDDTKSQELLNSVNVMAVADNQKNGYFKINHKNLKARKYPLERFVYLHTLSKSWGVENGFIRFACSKPGQLVTEKMGLIPFYIIPKEFLLDTKPIGNKK